MAELNLMSKLDYELGRPFVFLRYQIANFGMWDFKNFFIRNTLPEGDFLNPCQAPEVMIGGERPTLFSDAWSLGAVVLQWMTRLPPWDMQVGAL